MKTLKHWYADLSKKQCIVMWIATLVFSAIPVIGWFGIAPWLIPLVLFLEFQRESINREKTEQ
jgi:hypothetical protein